MKKTVAMLLALCLLAALSGCVSRSDVDAAAAQRDALRENLDALQEEYDALQTKLERHSELIRLMEEEKYDAVLEKLEEMQAAKEKAAAEMLEPYLVTVELTMDNFDDYFEWKSQTVAGDHGEEIPVFYLASKVYDQGLILYKSDAVVGVRSIRSYSGHVEENKDPISLLDYYSLYSIGSVDYPFTVLAIGHYRVGGTVTFVKADAVTDYRVEDGSDGREYGHITLINGEKILHKLHFGESF